MKQYCHKISCAEWFAAALAKVKKAELVTGDPDLPALPYGREQAGFQALKGEIKIHWLKD